MRFDLEIWRSVDLQIEIVCLDYGNNIISRQAKSRAIRQAVQYGIPSVLEKEYAFSFSHTERYSCAVFTRNGRLGTDIEKKYKITKFAECMKWLFPRDCPIRPELQWCIHEAVGKAEGTGLGRYYPLKSVEILPNQILRIIYLKEEREIKMEGKFFENLDYMFLFGYVNLL